MVPFLPRLFWFVIATTFLFQPVSHAAPKSLAEAAVSIAKTLPKGAIVTAEAQGDAPVQYSAAGAVEPAGVPPEKIIFEIGSISKVFTGILLAQTVLEKKVTLDTTLHEVMGEKQAFADPAVAAITLRQLVTHTSGLPRLPANFNVEGDRPMLDPYAKYDRSQMDAAVAAQKLEGKPPFAQSYSNFAVGLLGDILARLHGKTWEQLIKERITGPLGMSDTVVTLNEEQQKRFAPPYDGKRTMKPWTFSALAGAGALRSTATDMVKFGKALLAPEQSPLKDAIALMLEPLTPDKDIGMAIMLEKDYGEEVREHAGGTGGYRTLVEAIPSSRGVRVILINNAAIEPVMVIAATRNEKPRLKESDKVLTVDQLAEYEGVYTISPQARFTLVRRGDRLWTQLTGQAFFPLFPHEKEDRFFLKIVAAEMQFHRENGRVVSLTNQQNGRELTAKKSSQPAPKILFPSAQELAEFTGSYVLGPKVTFTLRASNETLFAQLTGQPPAPVFEKRKDWFEYDVVVAALEFERDKDGKVIALKLHQNGLIQRAAKKG